MEKLQTELGEVLKQSITTQELKSASGVSECQNFNFDIKIVSIKGKFCKAGTQEFTASIGGVEIQHDKIDLSKGEFCHKVSLAVEEVQFINWRPFNHRLY